MTNQAGGREWRAGRWHVYGDRITRSGPAGHGGADDDHRCPTAETLAESVNTDYDRYEAKLALLPEALAALRKVRWLIAEHDIETVHPLTWVNLIADDLDPLIAKLQDGG